MHAPKMFGIGLSRTGTRSYYPQLDRLYPRSKFILTVREKASWLKSCETHWTKLGFAGLEPANAPFWRVFASFIDCCVFGCHGFNPDRLSSVYDAHIHKPLLQ